MNCKKNNKKKTKTDTLFRKKEWYEIDTEKKCGFFNIDPRLGEILKGKKAISEQSRAAYGIWMQQEQGGNERQFF